MIVPPDWYFREMKAMLEEHGILLIADEIQTARPHGTHVRDRALRHRA